MTKQVLEAVSVLKLEAVDKEFTVYGSVEEPLILAKEVAEWIDNKQPTQMVELVDDDEKLKCLVHTSGQKREMWFLTDDGVYEVLMQSRKPVAKAVKKEVKAILKQLRKEGVVVSDSATYEQVIYNVDLFMANLNNYDITKLYDLVAEFLQHHRANKTRLPYKYKSKARHGNKKYKSHIESMEEVRDELVAWLNVRIDSYGHQQIGLATELIRVREMVRVSVENMRYRTAATSK
ncbi:BRO-N domain-containing protein [Caryophanon tenue]|uniref:Bro-N domain-containing protein n=1 Tax=Caryophanon tenue TaxID=33978 RepID=A0A1C0Y548_9BACL|nr:Bro-N domain-containing protein [Caryophanon tenue]OCS82263.1 hypothetical protein A6M13_07455 [Caryophanon tenue]